MALAAPLQDLQRYTEAQVEQHAIPALSLAIWKDNQLHTAATGILNLHTGVKATTEAIFQIGSITKVMTACLVMQLVDEGKIELDVPVKRYLPDFQIADAKATETITVRQLLNHTNGMAGDFFPDDEGHEGNLIARYVDRCALLPLTHPVGEMFSYSNSAYVIAGRLIEVVRGMRWDQVMKDYLYQPLGMTHAIADPKEVIRYRAAMGHVFDGEDTETWILSDKAWLPLGMAPCGSTPMMSAAELITFARAHLDNGISQSGEHWLSTDSVKAMQVPQRDMPQTSQINRKSIGLGWMLNHGLASGIRRFGHGGATMGFLSHLEVLPDHNTVYAILINGCRGTALEAVNRDLLLALSGVDCQEPDIEDIDMPAGKFGRFVGQYESFDSLIDVTLYKRTLRAHIMYKIDPIPPLNVTLKLIQDNCFAVFTEAGIRRPNIVFLPQAEGSMPQYFFSGYRLNRRV